MNRAVTFLLLVAIIYSCNQRGKDGKVLDTPTTGSVRIVADESLRPLVEAEVETFNGIYTKADVKAIYLPESEAFDYLFKDSVRLAVVTRRLTADEKAYFRQNQISAEEVDVAVSAIALIVHPENPDTVVSIAQLQDMLKGKITTWNQIGSKSKNGIEIVFDNPNSGLIRYLKDSIAKVEQLPPNCFAVKTNQDVVEHVSKNVNAIGLIGVEWISDDPASNRFLEQINVVGVAGDSIPFLPYQAYMALEHYPLMRTVTVINAEPRTGLATGFSSFFASERGQRIVLKTGLLPKTMPLRLVEVNPKPFEIEKQ